MLPKNYHKTLSWIHGSWIDLLSSAHLEAKLSWRLVLVPEVSQDQSLDRGLGDALPLKKMKGKIDLLIEDHEILI